MATIRYLFIDGAYGGSRCIIEQKRIPGNWLGCEVIFTCFHSRIVNFVGIHYARGPRMAIARHNLWAGKSPERGFIMRRAIWEDGLRWESAAGTGKHCKPPRLNTPKPAAAPITSGTAMTFFCGEVLPLISPGAHCPRAGRYPGSVLLEAEAYLDNP
jgi:hypothetical protein